MAPLGALAPTSLQGRLDRCAINTATLGFQQPIGATIDAVARAGFRGIGPWRRELEGEPVARVARHIRDAGLAVTGYCRSTYLPAGDAAARAAAIDDNRRAIDEAVALGAGCFVVVVGSLPAGSKDLGRARAEVADGVARLLEHACDVGVHLGLEPLHPMYAGDRACLNTLAQALDLADVLEPEPASAPMLGLVVDAYHVWWDPDVAAQIMRAGAQSRIFAYHVSDWRVPTRDLLNDRAMMGDGVIDLPALRGQVEAAGYRGPIEVEVFSASDWWRRPVAATLAACAERLQTVT